jgi:hypothetical protein
MLLEEDTTLMFFFILSMMMIEDIYDDDDGLIRHNAVNIIISLSLIFISLLAIISQGLYSIILILD